MKNILFSLVFCLAPLSLFTQNKQVLFLGNSYTGVNNLPQIIQDLALSAGDSMTYEAHTPGGRRLMQHAGDAVVHTKIRSQNWDFVSIQAQSQEPSFPLGQVQAEVFPFAKALCDSIRANDACSMPVFYMTWGRKNGDALNCGFWPPVCTYAGMDSLLNLRYRFMADENDALVSPAGAVWHYIRDNYPHIELYTADESHPSVAGSYAAACAFYSIIFRKSPRLITNRLSLVDSIAVQIRDAAHLVVFDSLSQWNVGKYDPVAAFDFVHTDSVFSFSNQSSWADSYFWDFGDGQTSTDPQAVHHYAMGGSYQVTLIAEKCGRQDSLVKTVSFSGTGIEQEAVATALHFSPNPADSFLFLEEIWLGNVKEIIILNLTGSQVADYQLRSDNRIDISRLQAGVYLLKIRDLKGHWYVAKFIKK